MRKNKKFGFTLIELLVVVALAAMILSLVFVQMRSAKQKNRDARREQDMKQLQNALNIYATGGRGLYPACPSEVIINGSTDCFSSAIVSEGAMPATPTDPLGGTGGTCGASGSYIYCYRSETGLTYTIRYALETNTIAGKTAGWQTINP